VPRLPVPLPVTKMVPHLEHRITWEPPVITSAVLERLTNVMGLHGDAVEQMATWREDLTIRIRRATLKFELIGLDPAEQESLEREAAEFYRSCRVLGWRP
jgi:hypothetical protein